MICPKCGSKISDNTLRCANCGVKVQMHCPQCNQLNLFGAKFCSSCGLELIKFCPVCKTANLGNALKCRKCGESFLQDMIKNTKPISDMEEPQKKEIQKSSTEDKNIDISEIPDNLDKSHIKEEKQIENTQTQNEDDFKIVYYSQIQANQKIVSTIKNAKDKAIIAINGSEGRGKSIVLDYVKNELQEDNILVLLGECNPLTQISNFGFIQDLFLRFLSLPAFITDVELFSKNNKKVFENVFNQLNSTELADFINFLYPTKKDNFENIIINQNSLFEILDKAFNSLLAKNQVVVIADDFDLIDASSYEYLMHFLEKYDIPDEFKLLVAYKDKRAAQSFFYSSFLPESVFENIYLDKLSLEQIKTFISNFLNGSIEILPQNIYEQIIENCRGNASYIEQVMALLHNKGYLKASDGVIKFANDSQIPPLPQTIDAVIQERLDEKSNINQVAKEVLFGAATIGYKFDIQILGAALGLEQPQLESILSQLVSLLFIKQITPYTYVFRSLSLWKRVFEITKLSPKYYELNQQLYNILSSCTLSNSSLKAIIAQNLNNPHLLFDIWQSNSELAAFVGDINLFVIEQKQCLKILNDNNFENSQILYNDICEKIGKLLYQKNPVEAIEYLSNVISNAKKAGDTNRIIDLCGYVVNSCYSTGNFYGVIEAINMIINLVGDIISPSETALIKSRKLKALFKIGNCEEVINLINNEILSELENALARPETPKNKLTLIYESWLETSLTLADAYSLQGNSKGFEIIDNILEIMQINKLESKYYQTKAALTKALSSTVSGRIKKSYDILNEITEAYKNDVLNPEFLSQWNLIYIINALLTHKFDNLKEELFSLATFANNTNDQFTKNIIKTILGYMLQRDENYQKSLEIYNEEVTYFAKEKIATGALLCWYFIATNTLTIDGADKALDIASRALDVAQNPKINNYNFIVYLQKFIAEIYIIKGDLDATKMYLEKALLIAKQFGMSYAQVELYLAYAKYLEEVISIKVVNKSEVAQNTLQMFEYATSIAVDLDLGNMITEVNKEKAAFKTYCQLNSIDIR